MNECIFFVCAGIIQVFFKSFLKGHQFRFIFFDRAVSKESCFLCSQKPNCTIEEVSLSASHRAFAS